MTRFLIAIMLAVIAFGGNSQLSLAQNDGSAIDSTIEMDDSGKVGDFEVTITDIDSDATEAVLDADSINEEPADGYQYVLVNVEVTYNGTDVGDPGYGLNYQSVGQSGLGYLSYTNDCGYFDNDESSAGELQPGDSATFVVCWSVVAEDVDSLVVYILPVLAEDDETVWFSIGNDAPTFEVPEIPDNVVTGNTNKEPVAFGETGRIGDYLVTIVDTQPDATESVLNENSYNVEPDSGNQFYLIRVHVLYVGEGIGSPSWELSYVSIGDADTEYTTYEDSCGVIPNGEFSVDDVFPGAEVEYNACWQIASDDESSLMLRIEDFVNYEADPVWFSLEAE